MSSDYSNTVRIIGIFLCLLSLIGIILNGSLAMSFIRYKALRTPSNIFVMFMSIIGFLASFIILPSAGVSSIYGRWLFNRIGCQIEAIMAFLYGCSTSYLLCAVCLTRAYLIVRPFQAKNITVEKCFIFASIALLLAFTWTMLPLFGWNEYTLERIGTSCCINWFDRRILFLSFNILLFIFVYTIPLIILLITNIIIYIGLKRMKEKVKQKDVSQKKIQMERRVLKSIIITVCGFILTWSPYGIIFFVSVYHGKYVDVPPISTFICACFAKSSVVWIPLLYMCTSTYYRFSFVDLKSIDQQQSTQKKILLTIENKDLSRN